MARILQAAVVSGLAAARLVDAVKKRLAADGFEELAPGNESAATLRFNVRVDGASVALVVASDIIALGKDLESAASWRSVEWAAHLSRALKKPSLAVDFWNFEGDGAVLREFAKGEEVSRRTLPNAKALAVAAGIKRAWLDPDDRDSLDDGDLALAFRRRVALPVLPRTAKGVKPRTGLELDAAAYRGRTHAVGTISFGAGCELENVSKLVSTFVRAFCPRDGLRVRVSRGSRCEVLPNRFTQTASISAAQLERGGSVELTEGDFDVAVPALAAVMRPLFWIESRSAREDENAARLSFGWCIARPGKESAELAISEAMSTMVEAATEAKDCISALVTAQGRPLTKNAGVLPYETLAGTAGRSEDASWLRAHVRSPAWLFLVPAAAARSLPRKAPPEVSRQRTRSGSLVRVDAPTPFAMQTSEALETWLLPVLGR